MKSFFKLKTDIIEDAPANNVGAGNIAGVGIGPKGEPGGRKSLLNANNSSVLVRNKLKEELDNDDMYYCITPSLLIRLLEYARETIKDDLTIHKIVDNMNEIDEDDKIFCAYDYDEIIRT